MGNCLVASVAPDGNGVDSLPWSPNVYQRTMAYTGVDCSDNPRRYHSIRDTAASLSMKRRFGARLLVGLLNFHFLLMMKLDKVPRTILK